MKSKLILIFAVFAVVVLTIANALPALAGGYGSDRQQYSIVAGDDPTILALLSKISINGLVEPK